MSHAGLTENPVAKAVGAASKAPAAATPRPAPTIPERLAALEKRQDLLEHSIMEAIQSLGIQVSQMHQVQLAALKVLAERAQEHDHSHAPAGPTIKFIFTEQRTDNTMYRVYQDGPDHPICPNVLNVHTRTEGTDVFDSTPVEQHLLDSIASEFDRQIGPVPNKVFFLEVHQLSDAPIDDSSVLVSEQSE